MAYLDNIRTFIRVHELGSMSAAARDQRISAAVASARIAQLEEHLNVRLFQRTTRSLTPPTEQGEIFYRGACRIVQAIDEAEAEITQVTNQPRGTLLVAAPPLGLGGRRLLAPLIPEFKRKYPLINIRLRLSDRKLDLSAEGIDVEFFLGLPEDSALRMKKIADCPRLLCATPEYIAQRGGLPRMAAELTDGTHDCLNLRYPPGAPEFQWILNGPPDGPRRVPVTGPLESDDGDVLTGWALESQGGIVLKPVFEVAEHLAEGHLVPVLEAEPPVPVQLACLYTHLKRQDPKTRLFIDFMADRLRPLVSARYEPR